MGIFWTHKFDCPSCSIALGLCKFSLIRMFISFGCSVQNVDIGNLSFGVNRIGPKISCQILYLFIVPSGTTVGVVFIVDFLILCRLQNVEK